MDTILIIDDDEVDREATKRALKQLDRRFNIVEANDVDDALELMGNMQVDCILVDYQLPGTDGLAFVHRLGLNPLRPEYAVVMMTSEGSEQIAVEAMRRGVSDYVVKRPDSDIAYRVSRSLEKIRLIQVKQDAEKALVAKAAELEQAMRKAEVASLAKSQFLAHMSHELRTPLNSILGFSEMIQLEIKGPLPEAYRQYAESIRTSGQVLLNMINSVLDLVKIEAGKMELLRQRHDIVGLVNGVCNAFAFLAEKRGIDLRREYPDGACTAYVDATRFNQVLFNLVGNALKFASDGGVTVRVSRGDGTIDIEVSDTGIGMDERQISAAIEPFQQVHGDAYARPFDGTGLGLPISKQIVELHGGHFEIASSPGDGTTVRLGIPVR